MITTHNLPKLQVSVEQVSRSISIPYNIKNTSL
jgi:hypothetical protein